MPGSHHARKVIANMNSLLSPPATDPTSLFELFRGAHATELLTAAVAHFDLFGKLADRPRHPEELAEQLDLQPRPFTVLITALKAMNLIHLQDDRLHLTELAAEHLVPGGRFDCGDYISLAAQSPGVLAMVGMLRTNRPMDIGDDGGTAFIYRSGIRSAMEREDLARHFTLALSGRAKNVAPSFAEAIQVGDARTILDVGGGTGIYSYALLQKNSQLTATILDRPEVLKIAEEFAIQYGVQGRCEFLAGDMFEDALPTGQDLVLLSNILHDWDVPECQLLIERCGEALRPGGRMLIHDVYLDDSMDGPLPIALYSASLFSFTEGRAYSAAEYRRLLEQAGLKSAETIQPTAVHCGVLAATR